MITDQFANALIPQLLSILNKGELPEKQSSSSGIIFMNTSMEFFDEEEYNTATEEEEEKQEVVAILPIKGAITKYSQWCGPAGTREMKSRMEKWKADDNIVGILFDIDSGGGQVSGTGEFARYVKDYPKPTLTYSDGMIASAAYYIASATDEIVMNKYSDVVGSNGTMCKYLILDGYYKKLGAEVIEAYATKSTKKNNTSREAKKGNLKPLIKEELDPINEQYLQEIQEYRPQVNSEVLNGQHYVDMSIAQDKGLIDAIGDKKYAIDRIFELADTNKSQNHNNQNMAEEQNNFEQLAATLGLEDGLKLSTKLFGGKKGVFLNEAQLQALESKLADQEENKAEDTSLNNEAENKVTALENAVTDALKVASLDAADSTEASIKLLGDTVAQYGSQPGETPTQTASDGDRFNDEDGIVNSSDAHNQIYNKV